MKSLETCSCSSSLIQQSCDSFPVEKKSAQKFWKQPLHSPYTAPNPLYTSHGSLDFLASPYFGKLRTLHPPAVALSKAPKFFRRVEDVQSVCIGGDEDFREIRNRFSGVSRDSSRISRSSHIIFTQQQTVDIP